MRRDGVTCGAVLPSGPIRNEYEWPIDCALRFVSRTSVDVKKKANMRSTGVKSSASDSMAILRRRSM